MSEMSNRVKKLEQAAGIADSELCSCPTGNLDQRVYHDGHAEAAADTRPAEVCARCGREKKIVKYIICYADEKTA